MVEKMRYVNIMGAMSDFDRVVETYVARYEIQLEYASKELARTKGVFAINVPNPYADALKKAEKLQDDIDQLVTVEMDIERAIDIIERAYAYSQSKDGEIRDKESRVAVYSQFLNDFEHFKSLSCDIEDLASMRFIKYRFGRMPKGSYKQFQTFLFSNSNLIFVVSKQTEEYFYGICFITERAIQEVESLLSAFHFERVYLPFELDGQPLKGQMFKAYQMCAQKLADITAELRAALADEIAGAGITELELASAYKKIKEKRFYFDMRKYAARTSKDFYILVGWMPEGAARALEKELENDPLAAFVTEHVNEAQTGQPPTKLKNPWPIKPFEFFVKMYGLPSYNEIDPTPFVALTYTLLFGIMFGDVGQGAVISIFGLILYTRKNIQLGAVLSVIGLSSAFFGFMYGSVFGLDGVFRPMLIKPAEDINSMLIVSVAIGGLLILISMTMNLVNSIRKRDIGKFLVSQNGVAGIVFYCSVIYMALMTLAGSRSYITITLVAAGVSLLALAFKGPLAKKLSGEREIIHGGAALFLFELVIELFETLLSYFTNTISFVRVGAFALSHAAIMSVVIMLSGAETGSMNLIGLIIGNLLVLCIEGLVVGIQALRLDFYEIFSRFYEGGGRAITPIEKP
ncbi:MAG: ATPase [Clostridiales bacterium]|nr:ATPase [Clostridiales bacterium]